MKKSLENTDLFWREKHVFVLVGDILQTGYDEVCCQTLPNTQLLTVLFEESTVLGEYLKIVASAYTVHVACPLGCIGHVQTMLNMSV